MKSETAFCKLSDGVSFKILPRFRVFLLFFGRKKPSKSAEWVLKKERRRRRRIRRRRRRRRRKRGGESDTLTTSIVQLGRRLSRIRTKDNGGARPLFMQYREINPVGLREVCHTAISTCLMSVGDIIFANMEVPSNRRMFFVLSGRIGYNQEGEKEVFLHSFTHFQDVGKKAKQKLRHGGAVFLGSNEIQLRSALTDFWTHRTRWQPPERLKYLTAGFPKNIKCEQTNRPNK